jgi:hypothetical protein
MRDVDNADDDPVFDNLIDHAEFASASRESALKVMTEGFTDAVGILRQRTLDELPARCSNRLRR